MPRQHARPRPRQREVAAADVDAVTFVVDQLGGHTRKRECRRSRLRRGRPGQRTDHDAAGLGLPPCVDDRAAPAADVLVVPHPRLGVDRLADGTEDAQRRQVVLGRLGGAPLHERADRGGRGVEDRHAVLLDDLPEPVVSGVVRHAFVHDLGGTVGEWAVHDVAVPGDPADIGRAPEHVVVGVQVEDVLVGVGHVRQVAAGRVHDALGFPGRARGVEQEEKLLGVHWLGGTVGGRTAHQLVVPVIATFGHVDVVPAALDDHDVLDRRGVHARFVGGRLEGKTVPRR